MQGAHAIFFFETLKCARIDDTSRVIRNPYILHIRKFGKKMLNYSLFSINHKFLSFVKTTTKQQFQRVPTMYVITLK